MSGLWKAAYGVQSLKEYGPAVRRFGSDARKFAETSPWMDEILKLGLYGTIFWSAMRLQKKNDAAEAAAAVSSSSN